VFRKYKHERVEYFTWAKCDHTFQERRVGNCEHEYKCIKCGHTYTVDSSD
jgi:hypothetical protein